MFDDNNQAAMECLANANLGVPATAGIDIGPDGTLKNWGCKEPDLKGTPACKCILKPFIDRPTYWPTQTGFQMVYVYK